MKIPGFNVHAEKYVNEDGTPYVSKKVDPKKTMMKIGLVFLGIVTIFFIYGLVQKTKKDNQCNKLEQDIIDEGYKYAKKNKLLPSIKGESVTIKLKDFVKESSLNEDDLNSFEESCDATVTYTNYNGKYVKSINITGCGYCASNIRYKKKTGETSKYDSRKHVVEVTTTYNYFTKESYYTDYTNYYPSEKINMKKSKKYGIYMPLDENIIPNIPDDGHIVTIEQDTKTYYRYRNKRWLYYRNNAANYSAYSSEKPNGYANKDSATMRYTEYSAWSLNYPDKKTYRHIEKRVGYRWYYKDGNKKVYYNNGEYTVDMPSEKYNKKGSSANMYRYRDEEWRWYNGTSRGYCGKSSTGSRNCIYRDEETLSYSDWSRWQDISTLSAENNSYREEEKDIYSRYRVKYDIYSYPILDNYGTKEELEQKAGKTIAQMSQDPHIEIDYKYTFKYGK